MSASPVLSAPSPFICLPSFVSLHLSPFMCLPEWCALSPFTCLPSCVSLSGGVRLSGLVCALSPFICLPEWWCPPLRSCLCLVSFHLSPFCALFAFLCLRSFVSLHLSPFCNIAYDRAVRKVSLRNMMSEKLPIHTPFPRSPLQFFKPDVLAVVLAGCAGHSCGLIALITNFQNIVIVIAIVIVIVTVIIVICYH